MTTQTANPYEQLQAAFAELGEQGIVAREDFSCCNNCGMDEIDLERTPRPEAAEGQYPYVEEAFTFFHMQDSERLEEGDNELYLSYGVFPGSSRVTSDTPEGWKAAEEEAGRQVAAALERHGLQVVWNGDARERIVVNADFASFPYPYEHDEDEPDYRKDDDGSTTYNPANNDIAGYILLSARPSTIDEVLKPAGLPQPDGEYPTQTWIHNAADVSVRLRIIDPITDPQLLADAESTGAVPVTTIQSHQAALEVYVTSYGEPLLMTEDQLGVMSWLVDLPTAVAFWLPYKGDVDQELDSDEYDLVSTRTVTTDDGTELLQTRGLSRFAEGELVVQVPADDEVKLGDGYWEQFLETLGQLLAEREEIDEADLGDETLDFHPVGEVAGVPSYAFNTNLALKIIKAAIQRGSEQSI